MRRPLFVAALIVAPRCSLGVFGAKDGRAFARQSFRQTELSPDNVSALAAAITVDGTYHPPPGSPLRDRSELPQVSREDSIRAIRGSCWRKGSTGTLTAPPVNAADLGVSSHRELLKKNPAARIS